MNGKPRRGGESEDDMQSLIRSQIHDRTNARFLRAMPLFQPDAAMPDIFTQLLERLEEAEAHARPAVGRGAKR